MKTEHVIMIVAAIVIIIIVVVIIVVMSSLTPTLCYTVSAGKDWSGTYYLDNNYSKFDGRRAYALKSGAYYLVWDTPTSYWTFLSKAQLQRVITSGLIATDGSGARTAIVPDNNGNPANSTAINDWQTSDATGTFSLSC